MEPDGRSDPSRQMNQGAAWAPPNGPSQPSRRSSAVTRRALLAGIAGSAAIAGTAGLALGYKFRHEIHDVWRTTMAGGSLDSPGADAFAAERARIIGRQQQQTEEVAAALKARYAKPVFGKVHMWDLIEKMGLCIDTTDMQHYAVSQFVHVKQVLAAMERNGVEDPHMYLIALLHDVGKVVVLNGARPEDIFGYAARLGDDEPGIGLENVAFRFGHAEFIYPRIKDHVPEPVAWVARYHNIGIDDAIPFMTARERQYTERYLGPFRQFDAGFKSMYYVPEVDMAKYRELIEGYFPKPILF